MILGRSTSGAIKIKTDNGLRAVSCGCCGPMIIFYSYDTDSTLGAGFDLCPDVGKPCGSSETGSCDGAVASGYIYSDPWSSRPAGKIPKAKIYAGACFDNFGSIGSATTQERVCEVTYTQADAIDTAEIEGERMRIPFRVINGPGGGPFGICGAVIEWYWE